MKNFTFLILFAFCTLHFFYSCNEDSTDVKGADVNAIDNLAEYKTAKFFEESVNAVSKELEEKVRNSFKSGGDFQLTQAELDQCIAVSGYNGTVPSLQDVNSIINLTMNAFENGEITFPMPLSPDYPPLSEKANNLLSQIFSQGSIENLKANSDFTMVSYNEQQLLEYINNIVFAMENGEIDFGNFKGALAVCGVNGEPMPCTVAFAALGGGIGAGFGAGGAIIGIIVGGVIGAFVDAS